jgi:hypothetical protein
VKNASHNGAKTQDVVDCLGKHIPVGDVAKKGWLGLEQDAKPRRAVPATGAWLELRLRPATLIAARPEPSEGL